MLDLANESMLLEDLKSHLECPVCFNVCRSSPIYQCGSGHMICSPCHERLVSCPICRKPLCNQRLLFAEKLLEKLPRKCKFENQGCEFEDYNPRVVAHEQRCAYAPSICKYHKFGCDVQLAATAITHHENNCDFITMKCPIPNCSTSDVVKSRLIKHLDSHHVKRSYKLVFFVLMCLVVSLAFNCHLYLYEEKKLSVVESPTSWLTSGLNQWYVMLFTAINYMLARADFPHHVLILKYMLCMEIIVISYNLLVDYMNQ